MGGHATKWKHSGVRFWICTTSRLSPRAVPGSSRRWSSTVCLSNPTKAATPYRIDLLFSKRLAKSASESLPKTKADFHNASHDRDVLQQRRSAGEVKFLKTEDNVDFYGFRKMTVGTEPGCEASLSTIPENKGNEDQVRNGKYLQPVGKAL